MMDIAKSETFKNFTLLNKALLFLTKLTNIITQEIKPRVLQTDIREHFPTFAYISKHKTSYNKKHEMYKRNLKNFNSESFADRVSRKLKNYFDDLEISIRITLMKDVKILFNLLQMKLTNLLP